MVEVPLIYLLKKISVFSFYLKSRVTVGAGEENHLSVGSLPKGPQQLGLARPKPRAWNSAWISHMGVRGPSH